MTNLFLYFLWTIRQIANASSDNYFLFHIWKVLIDHLDLLILWFPILLYIKLVFENYVGISRHCCRDMSKKVYANLSIILNKVSFKDKYLSFPLLYINVVINVGERIHIYSDQEKCSYHKILINFDLKFKKKIYIYNTNIFSFRTCSIL